MRARVLPALVLLGVLLLATRTPGAEGVAFYVSPAGDDAWSGGLPAASPDRADGPFRSLERARDAAREVPDTTPVRILLREGIHRRTTPLLLGPEDSGTAAGPRTWAAQDGEHAAISGGTELSPGGRAPDGAWTIQVPEAAGAFRHLFVRASNAAYDTRRYRPVLGPFVVAGLTDAPAREGMPHRRSQDEFRFHPGDLRRWSHLEDVEVVVLHDWSASRLRIRELDIEGSVVRFTGFPLYRVGHWWKRNRNPYFVENVREAPEQPGTWTLDAQAATVRYLPAPGEAPDALTFTAPGPECLIRLEGDRERNRPVAHVRFERLSLLHTGWPLPAKGYSSGQGMIDLPAAWDGSFVRHCVVRECTFAHLGGYALELRDGASDNQVSCNRMFDLGGGGVKIGRGEGVSKNDVVANNLISDGGLDHFSAHGIWAGITDSTVVRNNVVRRFGYSGISLGWKWDPSPTACRANVIEHNYIHHVMRVLADGGGIYTLGFQPGTVIRGNHIHDVARSEMAGRAPNNGIFLGQGSKGFRIEENAIHQTSGKPVRFHQSNREWHVWRDNHLGTSPPAKIVRRAGLEPRWRHLERDVPTVPVPPVQRMPAPPDPETGTDR